MKTKLWMSAAAIAVLMAGGANAQSPNAGSGGAAAGTGASSGVSGGASGGSVGSGGAAAPSVRGGADAGGSGTVEPHGSEKGGMRAQEGNAPKGHPRSAQDNKAGQAPGPHTATDSKGSRNHDNAANGERMNRNSASDSKPGEGKTTGNAATAAKGAPPVEKRTQITSAIKKEKVTAVTNVSFNVSVGTRVPTSVHFYPVPASVIAIYPEWRGYEFILVGGRYVIVAPETHEIVYILA